VAVLLSENYDEDTRIFALRGLFGVNACRACRVEKSERRFERTVKEQFESINCFRIRNPRLTERGGVTSGKSDR